MTVLIVDDEAYMVEYMKDLVDWKGYGFDRVLTATGGSLAKDLLDEYQPDLLITDIRMPKISGLDLSMMIYEKKYPTKIIILSGYSDFEYANKAMRYEASEYVVKPVLKEDFEEVLDRIVERHFKERLQKEVRGCKDNAQLVAYIKEYISENCEKDLSLDILGAMVHLHPNYLSKMFKDVAGENLSNYITDAKMKRATELLLHTDLKIQEVMNQLGYQKSQHFSKLFREKYGVSPREYRAEYREYLPEVSKEMMI